MERMHPQNIRALFTTHKHRPAHTHMLKLSPETVREQKSNGDVREKEGGNKDLGCRWKEDATASNYCVCYEALLGSVVLKFKAQEKNLCLCYININE